MSIDRKTEVGKSSGKTNREFPEEEKGRVVGGGRRRGLTGKKKRGW